MGIFCYFCIEMINILPIGFNVLRNYIDKAFEGDSKLVRQYHIVSNENQSNCVKNTYYRIKDFIEMPSRGEIYIFGIEDNNTPCGFIVLDKGKQILYSFGINIKNRTTESKKKMIDFVNSELNPGYYTFLYERNSRAINFLKSNNFTVSGELMDNNDKVIVLQQCQLQQPL